MEDLNEIKKVWYFNLLKNRNLEEKNWYFYENEARKKGFKLICGVDEAGRGPLAGPVFAAAVVLPSFFPKELDGINDSKKLTAKKREEFYEKILKIAVSYSVEFVNEKIIDKINILNATLLCMKTTIEKLNVEPSFVLIDGNKSPDVVVPCFTLIKGDSLSASIASASILAKVSRDRYMIDISEKYPNYGFSKHKGYGTIDHIRKIKEYGPCEIHRLSFLKKILG